MANPWIAAHDRWYDRATPAERAAFDASRSCPRSKVFTPKMFPTVRAWALFLTRQNALEEVFADTPLPVRHEVKGQVNVYDALQDQTAAIAGVGKCAGLFCRTESDAVDRCVITHNNGIVTEMMMCPECVKVRRRDAMYEVTTIVAVAVSPLDGVQ